MRDHRLLARLSKKGVKKGVRISYAPGHPSVGTAYALLQAGRIAVDADGLVRQECAAGLLPMRVEGADASARLHVRAPQARSCVLDPAWAPLCAAALGGVPRGALPAALYDNGPRWWLAELEDETSVRGQRPDLAAIARLCTSTAAVGFAVFADVTDGEFARVVRAYCPADGIAEDPVTGSANASIADYLRDAGRLHIGDRYLVSQGREIDRDGRIAVSVEPDGVWIGGDSVAVVSGTMRLPG